MLEIIKEAIENIVENEVIKVSQNLKEVLCKVENLNQDIVLVVNNNTWCEMICDSDISNFIDPALSYELIIKHGHLGFYELDPNVPKIEILTNLYFDNEIRPELKESLLYFSRDKKTYPISFIIKEELTKEPIKTTLIIGGENWNPTEENLKSVTENIEQCSKMSKEVKLPFNYEIISNENNTKETDNLEFTNLDSLPNEDILSKD